MMIDNWKFDFGAVAFLVFDMLALAILQFYYNVPLPIPPWLGLIGFLAYGGIGLYVLYTE